MTPKDLECRAATMSADSDVEALLLRGIEAHLHGDYSVALRTYKKGLAELAGRSAAGSDDNARLYAVYFRYLAMYLGAITGDHARFASHNRMCPCVSLPELGKWRKR